MSIKRLFVETNWDDELLPHLAGTSCRGIFGRPAGGTLTESAAEHIRAAKADGLAFGYALDELCLDNRELTREGNRGLRRLLDRLEALEVDEVIVSSFFLLELIKDKYPSLAVVISDTVAFDSVQRVREFIQLGAKYVWLRDMNRDFKQLKTLTGAAPGACRLVVNRACTFDCALAITHANERSHTRDDQGGKPLLVAELCIQKMQREPASLLKARWIRPEDLAFYAERGYADFVVYAPTGETARIAAAASAYDTEASPADLLDILSLPDDVCFEEVRQAVTLEAARLDGFLEGFGERDCRHDDCNFCGYCSAAAVAIRPRSAI